MAVNALGTLSNSVGYWQKQPLWVVRSVFGLRLPYLAFFSKEGVGRGFLELSMLGSALHFLLKCGAALYIICAPREKGWGLFYAGI
jgi:hypothetical protein